ncbi:tetratricopeptide repeat protein [Bryobacter aggregatus]|uniref:tetratricopeptide repeat protein n=1 Tax=Bryobacter aggregatus TaxID=360054 RepID=UPI0004E0C6F0|nr:tetratricopeptide repeat protein [Bryobacter aggregatus]
MDKALQNVIKHDQFVETVGEASEFVSGHKKQFVVYIVIAAVVAVLGYGGWSYMQGKKTARQLALGEAMGVAQATTSRSAADEKKVVDAFTKVSTEYAGSHEGNLALYMLAMIDLERGDTAAGEKKLKDVMGGDKEAASLAKYTQAEIYQGQGKTAEAEALLRDLMASPTHLMPKEQAILQLARYIAKTKPEEARKLLEPLRTARAPISTPAIEVLGTLPPAVGTPTKK